MRERQGERKKVRTKQINKMKDRLIETDREREREREKERETDLCRYCWMLLFLNSIRSMSKRIACECILELSKLKASTIASTTLKSMSLFCSSRMSWITYVMQEKSISASERMKGPTKRGNCVE